MLLDRLRIECDLHAAIEIGSAALGATSSVDDGGRPRNTGQIVRHATGVATNLLAGSAGTQLSLQVVDLIRDAVLQHDAAEVSR